MSRYLLSIYGVGTHMRVDVRTRSMHETRIFTPLHTAKTAFPGTAQGRPDTHFPGRKAKRRMRHVHATLERQTVRTIVYDWTSTAVVAAVLRCHRGVVHITIYSYVVAVERHPYISSD